MMRFRLVITTISIAAVGIGLVNVPSASAAPHDDRQQAGDSSIVASEGTVRALTEDEVQARGLDKYVDMSRYQPAEQTSLRRGAPEPATAASADGAAASSAQASGCWNHSFGIGTSRLYGQTDVTWCSDGVGITYTNAHCWGSDTGWPTYKYLGCDNDQNFGVGWTGWDVRTQWNLCPAWNPIWGSCISNEYPWQLWRYGAQGQRFLLGAEDS